MSLTEESQAEVAVSRNDWERFVASLERLIALHQKTLKRLRDVRIRNDALRKELASALGPRPVTAASEAKPEALSRAAEAPTGFRSCTHCGREVEVSARFCDRCGSILAVLTCRCGRDLEASARFCDKCGRPAATT